MFHRPSWLQRAAVALMLLASLGAGSVALPHADDPDAGSHRVAVAHDAAAHSIGTNPALSPSDSAHCFLCHTLRSFHPGSDTFRQFHYASRAERLHAAPIDLAGTVAWTIVPGRAPPA